MSGSFPAGFLSEGRISVCQLFRIPELRWNWKSLFPTSAIESATEVQPRRPIRRRRPPSVIRTARPHLTYFAMFWIVALFGTIALTD